jgi:hypothetical protein
MMKTVDDLAYDLELLSELRDDMEKLSDVPYMGKSIEFIDKAISNTVMKLSLLDKTI